MNMMEIDREEGFTVKDDYNEYICDLYPEIFY